MTRNARRRHTTGAGLFFGRNGLRTQALLVSAAGCVLAAAASAQSQECEGLAEGDKALCRLMVACAAIDDVDRREECFRVAANTVRDESLAPKPTQATPSADTVMAPRTEKRSTAEQAPRLQEAFPDPSAQPSAGAARGQQEVREGVAPRASPPAPVAQIQEAATVEDREKPRWRERIASIWRRDGGDEPRRQDDLGGRDESAIVVKQGQRTTFDIPRRFAATVTAVQRSGNRGLVALDGKLLFESDRTGEGNLRVGDRVRVVRSSRLYGRRFQITGPSRRPFVANRVRCERDDITQATRRQCRLLED